ncbi:lysophospholipid acyltransferase family protein [Sphaerotilus microaerophilus]|uniref:lysophospholipid acyltransferase family protein n=1 Tax=Sphaerotilus microaerophilus TaxID=2914710 RepID=UPI00207311CB|nr:lysophospholipid acyltransferase family protein [Sphaerotilus sp. FB-5]
MSTHPPVPARRSAPLWQRLLLTPWMFVLLLWLGVISLVYNLAAFVLLPLLSDTRGAAVGRAGIAYGYRLFWACAQASGLMRIDAKALDALNADPQGLIIAANHPSMADALLIGARLPRTVCIMKASLVDNIFLGAGARLARYIANDSPRQMIRAAVESLRGGGHLVLFPEGTRTEPAAGPRGLNPFRPGITLIALKAQAPIQTVIIETDSPYLGKGWPIWRLAPIPIVFRLRLGQRFEPDPHHDALLQRLEDYFRHELAAGAPR